MWTKKRKVCRLTKRKIKAISLEILDYLSTLEEGTEISTHEAAKAIYGEIYNNGNFTIKGKTFDSFGFIDIDFALLKYARRKGLELDCSKYAGIPIGMRKFFLSGCSS